MLVGPTCLQMLVDMLFFFFFRPLLYMLMMIWTDKLLDSSIHNTHYHWLSTSCVIRHTSAFWQPPFLWFQPACAQMMLCFVSTCLIFSNLGSYVYDMIWYISYTISCWGAKFLANSSQNLHFSKNIIFISVHYSSLISKICSFQKCQLVSFLTFFLMNRSLIGGTVMYRSLQWYELDGLSKSSVDTFCHALSNMYHHFKVQKDRFGSLNFMKYAVKAFIFIFQWIVGSAFFSFLFIWIM